MESHSTETVEATGPSPLSGRTSQCQLLPGQMERLQAQITAYRYLSRNMAVPPEILARSGPPEPISFSNDTTSDDYENDLDIITPSNSNNNLNYDDNNSNSNSSNTITDTSFVDTQIRRSGAPSRRRTRFQDPGAASLVGNYMPDHSSKCISYAPVPGRHVIDDANTYFSKLRNERVRAKVHYRVEELLSVLPQLPAASPTRQRAENEMKAFRLLDFQKRIRYQISQGTTSIFLMDSAFDTDSFAPAMPFAASGDVRVCYEPELPTLRPSTLREQGYRVFLNAVLDRSARMCQERRRKAAARAKVCSAVLTVSQSEDSNESINDAYLRISNIVTKNNNNNNTFIGDGNGNGMEIVEGIGSVSGGVDGYGDDDGYDDETGGEDIVAQEIAVNLQPFQLVGIRWLHRMYARGLSCAIGDDKSLIAMSYVSCFVANMARLGAGLRFLVVTEAAAINEWLHYLTHFASNVATVVYDGAPAVRREVYRRYVAQGSAAAARESAAIITTPALGFGELALDPWTVAIVDEGFSAGLRGSIFDQATATPLPNTRSKVMFLRYAWPTPGDEVKLFHFVCNKIISSQTSSSSSSSSSTSSSSSSSSLGSNEHNKNESGEMVTENTNKIQEEGNVITICDDNENENENENENNTVTNETNNNNEVVNETNINELINKHFVLRRDINDVRGLISDRFYTVIRCKMSSIQQIMYRDVCEEAYNNIETKRALEEGREPPKPRQHIFNVQAGDALLTQLQTICTHPFVLVDQYGFDDNIIRSSGKFDALDQILSKVGAFSNIHRFAIYTRKRKIAQILASYLKLREIDYLELRDPAELAGELDPSDPAGAEIHGIQGVIDTWNSQDEKARCVLISTIDTEGLPLVRTDTAVFLDPDWVPKVSTAMAFPMLGYDNTNPGNPYFSLKIFHLVTAYSVEENMLITASNTANWNAEAQAMADPVTFDKLCDNKTKQSILEAYLFKCSSIKYLENNQKELPLAVPGPLFNYAIARNSDELLLFNQIDQSTPADAFPRLLTDDGGAEEGAVGEPGMVGVEEDGSGSGGGMVMDPNAQAILSGASRKVVPRRVTSSVFGNNTTVSSNNNGQMPGGRFVEEEEEDLEMKEEVNGEEYLSKLTHLTLNNLCPGLPYNINADRSAICEATPKDLEELNSILAQKQHIQEQTQLRSIQQQQQQQQQGIQMQALGQMGMHSSPRKSPRKSKHDRHSKKDAKSKKDRDRHRSSSSSSSTGGITNVILNANGGSYIASGLITGETIPGGGGGDKDQMVVKQIAQSEFLQKQQAQQTQQAQAQQQQQQHQQGGIQMMQQDQQGAYIPQLILPQTQAPVHSASPQPQHSPQPQQMGGLIDPTAVPMGAGDPGMLVQGLGSNGVGSGGGVVVPPPAAAAGAGAGGEGGAVVPATAADGGVVRGGEEDEVVVDAGEDEEVVEDLASGSVVVPSISPHLIMPKDKTDEDNEKETMLNNKCREIIDSIKSITESQGTLMCMPLLSQVSKGLGEEYSQSPGSLDEVFARTYSTHEAFGFDMAILFSNATNYYQDQPNVVRNIDFLYRFFRDQYKSAFNANLAMPPQKDGEYAIFESEYKRLQKQLFNYELNPNYDEIIYDYADSSKFGSMLQNGGGPGGSGSGELGFNGSGSSDEDDYDEDEDEDDSSSSESGESSSARSDSDSSSSDSGESDRARRKRRARDISEASIQKKRHKKSSKSSSSSSSSSRRSGSKRSSMYAADGAGTVVLSSGMAQGIPTMGVIPSALTQDAVQGMGMQYPEKRSKSRHKHGHSHSHGRSHGRHHHHHHHRHHRSGEDSGVGFHSGLMMATPMIGNEKKKHNRK